MKNQEYIKLLKLHLKKLKKGKLNKSVSRTIIRVKALMAYYKGIGMTVVANCYDISIKTLKTWIKKFEKQGVESLPDLARSGRPKKLEEKQLEELKKKIVEQNQRVWLARHVYLQILKLFSVTYSVKYIPELLRQLGLSYQKTMHFLVRRDSEKRREWIETKLPQIYDKKIKEGWRIFYQDEVGFETNGTLAKTWGIKNQKVKIKNYGRRGRVNLIGAFELGTGMFYGSLICNSVDARYFKRFICYLKYQMQNEKIILICDNASFHKARWLTEWVKSQSSWLKVEFLPAYSPDFNPIERLWRWMKTEFTHNKCFKSELQLQSYLTRVINSMPKHAESLLSLMQKENERFKEICEHYQTRLMLPFDPNAKEFSGKVTKIKA